MQIAKVTIRQTFFNSETEPLEAVYVFPLDDKAAVSEFSIRVGDRIIQGEVQENAKVRELYDAALSEGHGAYRMEEHKPDVFQIHVGNLPPQVEAVVTLSYVTELGGDGHESKFSLPTAVAPRYCPSNEEWMPELVYNHDEAVHSYGFQISAVFNMAGDIKSVSSPSHEITAKIEGRRATAQLQAASAALDRDLVIFVEAKDHPIARVTLEEGVGDAGNAAMVTLVPNFEFTGQPGKCELIFVTDCSGSMTGSSIAQARAALQLFLRSLPPDCFFNICTFGSDYRLLFSRSRKYNDASLEAATKHVDSLDADMGGTEIYAPLDYIHGQLPLQKGYDRKVGAVQHGVGAGQRHR